MFPYKALLSLILISGTAVDATPLSRTSGKASLSVATKINQRGTLNIAEQSRARAQALRNASHLEERRCANFDISNTGRIYTANIGVGSPATDYTLLIDTGSSNTWIGASKPYTQTSTSKATGKSVTVNHGEGRRFSGKMWIDTVVLSADLVVKNQTIGVADSRNAYPGIDGVLGLGPVSLTANTVYNTDTVMDNLVAQKTVSRNMFGLYFVPASAPNSTGRLTFGGYDETAITSSVEYASLTTTTRAKPNWSIDVSITYGGGPLVPTTFGIVDSGNHLILLPSDAFQVYKYATGAGDVDPHTGLLTISASKFSALKALSFNIAGHSYDLLPNGQIWPRSLNNYIGGSSDSIYLIVGNSGALAGSGLGLFIGYPFLERYYTVFDADRNQLGFAATAYTEATTN